MFFSTHAHIRKNEDDTYVHKESFIVRILHSGIDISIFYSNLYFEFKRVIKALAIFLAEFS